MWRPILLLSVLLVLSGPAVAPAAPLYTSLNQPNNVQNINSDAADATTWVAGSFVPTQSGTARLVSFYAQTQMGSGFAVATMRIYTDASGQPGSQLASGSGTIGEITATSPSCFVLNATPGLSAGTRYWAVFSATKPASWLFWRETATTGAWSTNSGSTWAPRAHKTFGLRVDSDAQCVPIASSNPASGIAVGEMFAKPGGTGFNTVTISNTGTKTLKVTGGGFTGLNADAFSLLRGQPGGPDGQPFTFPEELGANAEGVLIFYVTCNGSLPQGSRTATLFISTDDPARPTLQWPVSCLVDSTPPTLQFSQTPNGLGGWWISKPASLTVTGIDPESGNRVVQIGCTDSSGPALTHNSGPIATFQITTDGVHNLACQGRDVAGNTGTLGGFKTTVKLDTVAPDSVKVSGPAATIGVSSATFSWNATDATSGVQTRECRLDGGGWSACTSPATRTGLADGKRTFEVRTRDAAGHYDETPSKWEVVVDTTAPDTTLSGGPGSPTTADTATFTIAGDDGAGSGVKLLRCSLDGAQATTCPAGGTFSALAEGHHTLTVWAVDQMNHQDATPAQAEWDVDRTAPTAVISAGTDTSFAFGAADAGAAAVLRYECSLDGAEFTVCESPLALTDLAPGEHVLEVRAIDVVGNVQAVPARHSWTVAAPPAGGGSGDDGGGSGGDGGGGGGAAGGLTQPPSTQPPSLDRIAPVVAKVKVRKRRRLSFTLTEAAKVAITFRKKITKVVSAKAGTNRVRIPRRVRRGRCRIVIVAADAAGNVSAPVTKRARV